MDEVMIARLQRVVSLGYQKGAGDPFESTVVGCKATVCAPAHRWNPMIASIRRAPRFSIEPSTENYFARRRALQSAD